MTALLDQNVEDQVALAERSVLGAAMRSLSAFEKASAVLSAADFASPRHQVIWNAIREVVHSTGADRVNPDLVLTGQRLIETGRIEDAGGLPYLAPLFGEVTEVHSASYYARIVKEAAQQRALALLGARLEAAGRTPMDRDERAATLSQAMLTLESLELGTGTEDPTPQIGSQLDETLGLLEGGSNIGVTTGLSELDRLVISLTPGQVIVVGARPATGKTVVAQHLGLHVAKNLHRPALAFTLEMSRTEMLARLLATEARINSSKLNLAQPSLDEDDWARLAEHLDEVMALPLYVCDEESLTPARMDALIGGFKRKHPDLAIVTIDYAQLLTGDNKVTASHGRQQEMSEVSRQIKMMAKRHKVAIVLLCQLNRGPMQRADRQPEMSDLKESGAFEQDADIVILLYRPDQFEQETARAGELDLIVAKNRGGPTGTATVAASMHYYKLQDMGGEIVA